DEKVQDGEARTAVVHDRRRSTSSVMRVPASFTVPTFGWSAATVLYHCGCHGEQGSFLIGLGLGLGLGLGVGPGLGVGRQGAAGGSRDGSLSGSGAGWDSDSGGASDAGWDGRVRRVIGAGYRPVAKAVRAFVARRGPGLYRARTRAGARTRGGTAECVA